MAENSKKNEAPTMTLQTFGPALRALETERAALDAKYDTLLRQARAALGPGPFNLGTRAAPALVKIGIPREGAARLVPYEQRSVQEL